MLELPYRPGQFVWCLYPFREFPDRPGPLRHIGYVLDVVQRGSKLLVAAALYTTTSPWPTHAPLPRGVIAIREQQARAIGQRPFFIDARRIAYMPVNEAFFPDLQQSDKGVVGEATPGLVHKVEAAVVELLKRPDLLELLGPERPTHRPRRRGG